MRIKRKDTYNNKKACINKMTFRIKNKDNNKEI